MHINTPVNSIFDGPITSLLSMLRILIEILSCAHEKEGVNGLKFGTFIGCFPSDSMASMTMKGLKPNKI